MTIAELELLKYFKQKAIPLFTVEELQAIHTQCRNMTGKMGLQDNIIHKIECCLFEVEQGWRK